MRRKVFFARPTANSGSVKELVLEAWCIYESTIEVCSAVQDGYHLRVQRVA